MSILIDDVSFSYGAHEVLGHVSARIETGELVCVLGPNGVGKSTLFRCILALEEGFSGRIEVDGRDVRACGPRARSHIVSFVPQAHHSVYDYDVLDMVLMSTAADISAFGTPSKRQRVRAWEALERVGIAHLAHRSVTRISGGELQLVLIARALAQNARTIVMDEPTSALDYGNTVRVLGCVRQLARDGYTIIQSTHQPDQVFLYGDKVLALLDGGVRAFGAPHEVVTPELIADLYGVDVKIRSLFEDRVRVCVPALEIDR